MTGQELIDRCEERFGDTTNAVIPAVEWLSYVNAAYRAFIRAVKWRSLVTETTAAIAANGRSVALPAAALNGEVVDVLVNGIPLEPQPPGLPERQVAHWSDHPTVPMYFEIRGSRVSVLPAWAAGGNLTIAYLAAPTALTTVSSPVTPTTYDDALIAGALAQAYRDDGNSDLGNFYQAEFDRIAAAASQGTVNAPVQAAQA